MSAAARRVLAARIGNQFLDRARRTPAAVVAQLYAVQAQDFIGAKWAIGLRAHGLDDAAVEAAFNAGEILRTHVMRPTWHFVTRADIRWMLALTAPRVHQASKFYYGQHGLDARTMSRVHKVLAAELQGGRFRTRTELATALAARKIDARGPRLGLLTIHAELEQVMCSAPPADGSSPTRSSTIGLRQRGRTDHASPAPSSPRATSPATGRRRCAISYGGRGSPWRKPVAASSRRLPHWSSGRSTA